MKLTTQTKEILQNYATINPSILIKKGNCISTLSTDKTVAAFATVDDNFPEDFAIYDLSSFLNVINLFAEPELNFDTKKVDISAGKSKCTYMYADAGIVTSIDKKVNFPDADVNFKMTKEDINILLKASNTLGLSFFQISKTADSEVIYISVVDPKNPSSNSYTMDIGVDTNKAEYNFLINTEYLRLIKSDYEISLSSKLISRWTTTNNIEYFVAVDKSSTFKIID